MFPKEFMKRLKLEEPDALQELEQMSLKKTEAFVQFFHEYVLAGENWNHSGLTSFLLKTLNSVIGRAEVEKWIRSEWDSMSEKARLTILHCFQYTELVLSTELAVNLFRKPSTSSLERHSIVAGLYSSAQTRKCDALVLELVDQIGRHDDAVRQATLESFRAGVKSDFAASAGQKRTTPQ